MSGNSHLCRIVRKMNVFRFFYYAIVSNCAQFLDSISKNFHLGKSTFFRQETTKNAQRGTYVHNVDDAYSSQLSRE